MMNVHLKFRGVDEDQSSKTMSPSTRILRDIREGVGAEITTSAPSTARKLDGGNGYALVPTEGDRQDFAVNIVGARLPSLGSVDDVQVIFYPDGDTMSLRLGGALTVNFDPDSAALFLEAMGHILAQFLCLTPVLQRLPILPTHPHSPS